MSTNSDDWCSASQPTSNPQAEAKTTQQERGITMSALCAYGWSPLLVTGLCIDLLRQHFTGQVAEDDLRHLVWRKDERTGILIEHIHRWRGTLVEKRPAVIVKRNAYQNMRIAIGDQAGVTEEGFREFTTVWVGSHTFFCLHGNGASVELLATEVQRELSQRAYTLVQELGLLRWAVTEVGEIAEIEEAKENFVVPVTVGWAYQDTWRVQEESLKLRKVSFNVLLGEEE